MRTRGFTLIEIMVVLALFSTLMLVGTNIFLQVVQSANRAALANELRQNSSVAMETVARSIREAGCVSVPNSTTLILYSADVPGAGCNANTQIIQFQVGATLTEQYLGKSPITLSSPAVTFSGSSFATAGDTGPVTVTFLVSSSASSTRYDFQDSTNVSETISLRHYSL